MDNQDAVSGCSTHTVRPQDPQESQKSRHSRSREVTPVPKELEEDFQESTKTGNKRRAPPNFAVNTENRCQRRTSRRRPLTAVRSPKKKGPRGTALNQRGKLRISLQKTG